MDDLYLIGINECGEEVVVWSGNIPYMPDAETQDAWEDYLKNRLIAKYIPEPCEWRGFYWEDRRSWYSSCSDWF